MSACRAASGTREENQAQVVPEGERTNARGDCAARKRRYCCLPASLTTGTFETSDNSANPDGGGISKIVLRIFCWSLLLTGVSAVAIPRSSAFLLMRSQSKIWVRSGSVPWHMKVEYPSMLRHAG